MSAFWKKIAAFVPAAVYYGAIFHLSSRSSFPLSEPFSGFDKVVHGAEFGVLGVFLALGFVRATKLSPVAMGLGAWICGVALGLADEFHQFFVPGRQPDIWDTLADALGVAVGAIVLLRLYRRRRDNGKERISV